MRTGIIYRYYNKESGHCYIGLTRNPKKRYSEHLRDQREKDWHIDYRKHPEKYEYQVLEENILIDNLDAREIYWIAFYDSYHNGYNKTAGGNSNREVSAETRRKLSEARKGKPSPRKGAVLSDETKLKISEANKGKIGYFLGKTLSETTKLKISESRKGSKLSENTKKILSELRKGRHWFNDGINNVFVRECPEGYVKGKLIKKK